MAKPQIHLVPPPLTLAVHNVPCGCGCGMINLNDEHIYSAYYKEHYENLNHMVKALEGEYIEGWIKLEWGTGWKLLTEYQFKYEFEVS